MLKMCLSIEETLQDSDLYEKKTTAPSTGQFSRTIPNFSLHFSRAHINPQFLEISRANTGYIYIYIYIKCRCFQKITIKITIFSIPAYMAWICQQLNKYLFVKYWWKIAANHQRTIPTALITVKNHTNNLAS